VLQEKEIKNARFTTEVRAGLTTFFTMAYVISVNVCINNEWKGVRLTFKGLNPCRLRR
jgi:hypothetical protein